MILPFKLPISYQPNIHKIKANVSDDLELKTMYSAILAPTNKYADLLINHWNEHFCSDTQYLKDTQTLIKTVQIDGIDSALIADVDAIITDLNADNFVEKYNYFEWKVLQPFNESANILQIYSSIQLISPIISFLTPFFILLFPFILLKIQGMPIYFDTYMRTLQQIGKSHIFGKLLSIRYFDIKSIAYAIGSIVFYLISIYQNIVFCYHFYNNIGKIHKYIGHIAVFAEKSMQNIKRYLTLSAGLATYSAFNSQLELAEKYLSEIRDRIPKISFYSIGASLQFYYSLFINSHWKQAVVNALYFEGFLNNIGGIYANKRLHFCGFNAKRTKIKQQFYPLHDAGVKNDLNLAENMVITGPNASGKTTILKTTTINILFSQQFGCGYYSAASINPYHHVHSYLNIPDTSNRDSLFQAEARRCLDIITEIKESREDRHFCLFDELYSGTNPVEATKICIGFLQYLATFKNVDWVLTTHYIDICRNDKNAFKNYKMDVLIENDKIEYLYKLIGGISEVRGGFQVLKQMNYPADIMRFIDVAGDDILA